MAVQKRMTSAGDARYDVRLRLPTGREVSRTFKTLRLAEQYEREQEHARDRGSMHDPRAGRISLAEWVDEWREIRNGLRPNTVRIYETNLKKHILPTLGTVELASVDRARLLRWLADLGRTELAPATVHQAYRVLRTVLASAVEVGRITSNPAAGRSIAPRLSKVELRIPSPDEVATLAETIEPRYRALVLVAAYCGLRRGELAGLRWQKVDLVRRRLQVVEQLDRQGQTGPTKTDAGRRTVPIPSFVVEALEGHLSARYSESPGLVFTAANGGAVDVGRFRTEVWVPACKAVGLDGLKLHDLRHACASTMIASGADLKRVQEVMGHGSATLTLDTYGHLLPDRLDDLADRMDFIARGAKAVGLAALEHLAGSNPHELRLAGA